LGQERPEGAAGAFRDARAAELAADPLQAVGEPGQDVGVVLRRPLDDGAGFVVFDRRVEPAVAEEDAIGRPVEGVHRPAQGEQEEGVGRCGADPVEARQLLAELLGRDLTRAEGVGRAMVPLDEPAGKPAERADRPGRRRDAARLERVVDLGGIGLGQGLRVEQAGVVQGR
jgi:hypothetical protein